MKPNVSQFISRFRSQKRRLKNAELILLAFGISFCLWVYIASSINTNYTVPLSNLTVNLNAEDALYGLSPLSVENGTTEEIRVNCEISGNRTAIGGLTRNDVELYVDYSEMQDIIGSQTLPIKLRTTNGAVFNSYTLSKSTITLVLDRYETRKFEVKEVHYPSLWYDDETLINTEDISVEPSTISISGPTSQLSLVDHVCVTIDAEEQITRTKTYTNCTHYQLMDKNSNAVSDDGFNVQATSFSVQIPVVYNRELPVTVDLSGVPAGFDTEFIMQRLRLSTLQNKDCALAGYGDNNLSIVIETADPEMKIRLDQMDAWSVGSVPLSALTLDQNKPLQITIRMEEGYTDISQLGSVYVTLDGTDLVSEQRWIANNEIRLYNGISGYTYALQSPAGNTAVNLIGTPEALAALDSASLIASVNLVNVPTNQSGILPQSLSIMLPETATDVWVSPQPTINISVAPAE